MDSLVCGTSRHDTVNMGRDERRVESGIGKPMVETRGLSGDQMDPASCRRGMRMAARSRVRRCCVSATLLCAVGFGIFWRAHVVRITIRWLLRLM